MKIEPKVSSETSGIRTQTPGNYPKKEHITFRTRRKLKSKKLEEYVPHDGRQFAETQCTQIMFIFKHCLFHSVVLFIYIDSSGKSHKLLLTSQLWSQRSEFAFGLIYLFPHTSSCWRNGFLNSWATNPATLEARWHFKNIERVLCKNHIKWL